MFLLFSLLLQPALGAKETQFETYLKLAREAVAQIQAGNQGATTDDRLSLIVEQLAQQSTNLEPEIVRAVVLQLSARLPADEKLRAAGESLIVTLERERESTRERHRVETQTLLSKSAKACLGAATAADLDSILQELASRRSTGDEIRRRQVLDPLAQQRLNQMFQFVSRWQDMLAARAAKDPERARSALFELRNSVDLEFIPRSRLYELESTLASPAPRTDVPPVPNVTPETVLQRLEKVETLDQLSGLMSDLALVSASSPDLSGVLTAAQQMLVSKGELESGHINLSPFNDENKDSSLAREWPILETVFQKLAAERRALVLRAVFRDSGLSPEVKEPTDKFIMRVARAAVASENWEYALRTLEFYRALFSSQNAPAWTQRELNTCLAYVAARQLDEAGQTAQAIVAYQEALGKGGSLAPVALIAKRLAEIRTRTPEAYAESARIPRIIRPPFLNSPFQQPSADRYPGSYLIPRSERPLTN